MSKLSYDFNKYIFKYVRAGGITITLQSDEPFAGLKCGSKNSQINAIFTEAAKDARHEVDLVPSSVKGLIYFGPEFDVGQVHLENDGREIHVVDDGRISTECDFSGAYRLSAVYAPDHLSQTNGHARIVRKFEYYLEHNINFI